MQPLYAIKFAVEGENAVETVVSRVRTWLLRRTDARPDVVDFHGPGEASVAMRSSAGARRIAWERIDLDQQHALRIDQHEPYGDQTLMTRITLAWSKPGELSFRLVLGIIGSTRLLPADLPTFQPPRLVHDLLNDWALTCTNNSQRVDARYVMIKEAGGADLLSELIDNPSRLPLMVLNTAEGFMWSHLERPTKLLATTVSGLARVVCLAWLPALARFHSIRPELTPPVGEAVLIWPSRHLKPEPFDLRSDLAGTPLLRRLLSAAVSVFGGRDEAWSTAERGRRQIEQTELQAQLMAATDVDAIRVAAVAQVTAKNDELARITAEHDEIIEMASQEVDALKAEVEASQLELYRLRVKVQALSGEAPGGSVVSIAQCRDYLAREQLRTMGDLVPLLDLLKTASDGAFVATENAKKVCVGGSYPDPLRIGEQLLALAEAAMDYKAAAGSIGIGLHEWLADRGLVNSTLDASLQKAKLHLFELDGETLDRTPHIKVDDHTHPDKVGRIYFAVQSGASARFVVDHIGQKLYLNEGKRTRKGKD